VKHCPWSPPFRQSLLQMLVVLGSVLSVLCVPSILVLHKDPLFCTSRVPLRRSRLYDPCNTLLLLDWYNTPMPRAWRKTAPHRQALQHASRGVASSPCRCACPFYSQWLFPLCLWREAGGSLCSTGWALPSRWLTWSFHVGRVMASLCGSLLLLVSVFVL
jgi:hypothetical protein